MTQPMPYLPVSSTQRVMRNFDGNVYTATPDTLIYKIVDAICGTTGAGLLINQTMINVLQGSLDTTYGADLDYFFGNIGFLPRSPAESYSYDPHNDMLTSEQWDAVNVKDAWYRARIKDFWAACQLGGTVEGIRMAVQAALTCDCSVFEVWRYLDNFGLGSTISTSGGSVSLGRAPVTSRNEVVIRPQKDSISPSELRLARDMLTRILPVETIVTINLRGLAVLSPVKISAAASNSTYYEVQKMVTATPVLSQMPPPELLPIDLLPTEQWLYAAKDTPQLAPYAQFNVGSQYGYYYLLEGGRRSPIDSVVYGTLNLDGSVSREKNFTAFTKSGQYTPWKSFEVADSPDNYPGGLHGIHPTYAPALNGDQTAYQFPWESQADYVAAESARITQIGGNVTATQYQLPVTATGQSQIVFYPEYAVAYSPPGKDSTVSAAITRNRSVRAVGTWTDPASFAQKS